jgi:hypothetical protein
MICICFASVPGTSSNGILNATASHLCVKDICALPVPEQEAACLRINMEELGVPSALQETLISLAPAAVTRVAWDLHVFSVECAVPHLHATGSAGHKNIH